MNNDSLKRSLVTGGVAVQTNQVADDDALASELAGLGGGQHVLVELHAVAAAVDRDDASDGQF